MHCDIKPANVFVDGKVGTASLRAILGDFYVSHTATGRTTTLTHAVGARAVVTHYTAGFAAPEIVYCPANTPPLRVSPSMHVFGLGCVIYAMHMHPPESTRGAVDE